jgi:hypothetical protein
VLTQIEPAPLDTIDPESANGVTVRVTFDTETTHPQEQQRQGWQAILNNSAKHVVTKGKAEK